MAEYQVRVYGKPDCQKCKSLNARLDRILAKDEWQEFEKEYLSLDTEEGLISFSESECINPQRIPAMLVARLNEETGNFDPVMSKHPGEPDDVCQASKLYQYLGLQTDYTAAGVLTPKMITAVLDEARR